MIVYIFKVVLYATVLCHICSGSSSILRKTQSNVSSSSSLSSIDDIILSSPNLFTTFATAYNKSGLLGQLCTMNCNSTIFVPNDSAFQSIKNQNLLKLLLNSPNWILHLQNFILFHITLPTIDRKRLLTSNFIDGQVLQMLNYENITINDRKRGISLSSLLTINSNIIQADIIAANGVVNIIDAVLIPTFFGIDIFALGDHYNDFQILTELLESIGLVGIRSEFTLIAPTDKAFRALGRTALEELRTDNDKLRNLLINHVIFGVYPSPLLMDGLVLQSLGGANITFSISKTIGNKATMPNVSLPEPNFDFTATKPLPMTINDANVLYLNILGNNGVVHVVDTVLFVSDDETSNAPTTIPSTSPVAVSSKSPSVSPSTSPKSVSSTSPSVAPSSSPKSVSSASPSVAPHLSPSTMPSLSPLKLVSISPVEIQSSSPTTTPSTSPIKPPIRAPSIIQSKSPVVVASTSPTVILSTSPTSMPSKSPSTVIVTITTTTDESVPSTNPTVSPSRSPTASPSSSPSVIPTIRPSIIPTVHPSIAPTIRPSVFPTFVPSTVPMTSPSSIPTVAPSIIPTTSPSSIPTVVPSIIPTTSPSNIPSTKVSSRDNEKNKKQSKNTKSTKK